MILDRLTKLREKEQFRHEQKMREIYEEENKCIGDLQDRCLKANGKHVDDGGMFFFCCVNCGLWGT